MLIVVAAMAGGSVAPFAKVALEVFPPFTLVVMRFAAAALSLLPLVYRNGDLNARTFHDLAGVAVVGALNPILLFIALQFTPSSVSPLIYAAGPLLTALYLRVFRQRKILPQQGLGLAVGFAGVALIILLPFFTHDHVDLRGFWGNLLILGATISFVLYGIFSGEKQQNDRSPVALTFYFCVVTLALALPAASYELVARPVDGAAVGWKHVFAALEIGVIGTSLFYLAYQQAIQSANALTASLFAYLQPVATILLAVVLLGEEITLPFVIGGTLAVIGAQMASRQDTRARKMAQAEN